MQLSKEQLQAAVIGTRQSGEWRNILIQAAQVAIGQQAGYIVDAGRSRRSYGGGSETLHPLSLHWLRRIAHQHPPVLAEWARLIARKRWMAPPEIIPHLLQIGIPDPHMRPYISPITGKRGFWIARILNNRALDWVWFKPECSVLEQDKLNAENDTTLSQTNTLDRRTYPQPDFRGFAHFKTTWSLALTTHYMNTNQRYRNDLLYYFSPDIDRDSLEPWLFEQQSDDLDFWLHTLDFRREMIADFQNVASSS